MLKKPRRFKSRKVMKAYRDKPCSVCGSLPSDPSHIRSRGAGGPDEFWNIIPLCRVHHIEWGRLGWSLFLGKHPKIDLMLAELGWVNLSGKLYNPKLRGNDDET